MPLPRSSGILLHPTSLPGRYGIGDLGLEAYQFVDFLARSGQQLWQILPLGPPGLGNSPYMSFSTMAGNPLLISPDVLQENGLLSEGDLRDIPDFPSEQVDFEQVIAWKMPLLRQASQNFAQKANGIQQKQFEGFCRGKSSWLEDYALFMVLSEAQEGKIWTHWSSELRHRQDEALARCRQEFKSEIYVHKFLQFEFFRQWSELKRYANDQKIQILGDLPIYVAHNSADVWSHPEIFQLDPETGEPTEIAGVPPDCFSATGQVWGNPIYDWEYLEATNFDWWVRRVRESLSHLDLLRIDHFRGLQAYWSIPAGEKTAMKGKWVEAPGYALFNTIRQKLGNLPIIAEDLGAQELGGIIPEVEALRDYFEFPGMKILQFAFGSDAHNPYLPFNLTPNSVIYTGTHDNNTTVGWYDRCASEDERQYLHQYLGGYSAEGIAWALIRLALSSVANQAIIPLQDVLSLGSNARLNTPSQADGNWGWRYRSGALREEYSHRLREMVTIYGRYHQT